MEEPIIDDPQAFWDGAWGRGIYPNTRQFQEVLKMLQDRMVIGDVVVDVGAGADPATGLLDSSTSRIIEIDRASDGASLETLRVRLDIEDIFRNQENVRRAIVRIASFLNLPLSTTECTPEQKEQVDNFIFSAILNYIDYKQVIRGLLPYLNKGGEMIFNETVGLGLKSLLSPEGLKSVEELETFLRELGLNVKTMRHPEKPKAFLMRAEKPMR